MKKILSILICFVIMFFITGCGDKEINSGLNNNQEIVDENEIRDPVINWWNVYKNTNNTKCVTVEVSNPNNYPIGFSYDLVYYKDGNEVKRESNWANTGIEANGLGIIYSDIKVPSSDEVDDIKLDNIYATKFEWNVLKSSFDKTFIDNEVQYFKASFSGKPSHTEIWAVLYNDLNNNGKVEKNEFIDMGMNANFINILDTTGEVSIPARSQRYDYTDYKIYSFAFSR